MLTVDSSEKAVSSLGLANTSSKGTHRANSKTMLENKRATLFGGIISERNLNSTQLGTSDKEMLVADEIIDKYHNVSFMGGNDFELQSNPESHARMASEHYALPLMSQRDQRDTSSAIAYTR